MAWPTKMEDIRTFEKPLSRKGLTLYTQFKDVSTSTPPPTRGLQSPSAERTTGYRLESDSVFFQAVETRLERNRMLL